MHHLALRDNTMLMSGKKIMAAPPTAHRGKDAAYVLGDNDRSFSKRVYTKDDLHTGQSQPWNQSSIDLSLGGGSYFGLNKDEDLSGMLASGSKEKQMSAIKDLHKPGNYPMNAADLKNAYYN